jgi:hypothetical protein
LEEGRDSDKTISHKKAQKAQEKVSSLPHFLFVLFVPFCG